MSVKTLPGFLEKKGRMEEMEKVEKEEALRFKLFAGNANRQLASEIADYLGVQLGNALVSNFANGEIQVKIEENVRGCDVFVIQPTSPPVNDNLMELLIMIDALHRASASKITAVIPYYGYAKQEKKTSGREPISAKLVANIITVAGASRVVTIDLHAAAIQGFFDIPVDNLVAIPIISHYLMNHGLKGDTVVVVSPDAGGVMRARTLAERLGGSLAIIFKRRPQPDMSEVTEIVGNVGGKRAVIVDDMISTGGTLVHAAEALLKMGAKEVYACSTHAVMAKNAIELIEHSQIRELIVTNTIPLTPSITTTTIGTTEKGTDTKGADVIGITTKDMLTSEDSKIRILSIAPLLGEAIKRIYLNRSVSELFD